VRSIAGGAAQNVDRKSAFSYACNACGLCCHEKVITLSPYDVLRIARGGSHDRRGERQSGEPRDVALGKPFAPRNLDQGLDSTGSHFFKAAPRASDPLVAAPIPLLVIYVSHDASNGCRQRVK